MGDESNHFQVCHRGEEIARYQAEKMMRHCLNEAMMTVDERAEPLMMMLLKCLAIYAPISMFLASLLSRELDAREFTDAAADDFAKR